MRIVMIDNYDSFTYNIVQYLGEIGHALEVVRNDALDVKSLAQLRPQALVVSPGPCSPKDAGISIEAIQYFAGKIPVLGVCLGHQAIGQAFGGKVISAKTMMHGKTSLMTTNQNGMFKGLPKQFVVNRYHSLALERESLPACLEISAWTDDGEIMALRHTQMPSHARMEGVQFHPESVLSEHGHAMFKAFFE